MARVNRYRTIDGVNHLGKSRLADFNFKEGRYSALGAACAVGAYIATDAECFVNFNAANIVADFGLTGPPATGGSFGLTGALLTRCLLGCTLMFDYVKPNLTQTSASIYCTDSSSAISEQGFDEIATTGFTIFETAGDISRQTAACRQQLGTNRIVMTLGIKQLIASVNGGPTIMVQSRVPSPAIAHIGVGSNLAAGAISRLQILGEVLDTDLVQALSRL